MFRNLSKTLTAGALAVSLAATGVTLTAAPAAANGHRNNGAEAAAIFGGLLLLYGLSQANRNNANRHNPPVVQHPRPPHQRIAPARCFIQGNSYYGNYSGYLRRCMQNNAQQAHLLPATCLRTVQTQRGQRQIYGARCLANYGWSHG